MIFFKKDTATPIVLIGARAGSKRVVGKNLRILVGHPLVTYPILAGKSLKYPVYLSTDSLEIGASGKEYGAEISWRPSTLASDTSTDYDWISHFIKQEFVERKKSLPSIIVFLRPTTPLRCLMTLINAINSFKNESTSLRSIEELCEPVEKTFKMTNSGYLCSSMGISFEEANKPAQSFAPSFKANGYIDILRPEVILETKTVYGNKIQGYITPKAVEIDNIEDFKYAEYILETQAGVL